MHGVCRPRDHDVLWLQLECAGQKLCSSPLDNIPEQVCLYDHEVRSAKLEHDLTTCAARRYGVLTVRDDSEMREISWSIARGDGAEKRCALRAVAETI